MAGIPQYFSSGFNMVTPHNSVVHKVRYKNNLMHIAQQLGIN